MKYYYMLVILVLGVPIHLFAQHNINGQVLSAIDSVPLRGATIQIGDTLKALSDDEGRFNFNHFTNAAKLRFTLVGYNPLTASSLSEAEKYYLIPSENLLDEVMVNTGYQRVPKERATGSFEFVDSALFHRQITTDVISRLDGLVSGLLFDKRNGQIGMEGLSIRGLSTLTPEIARPLIVVDNFPYEGDINNINPNDVESVTLLRDAAAASIWGARAGNGVLVITTKKANIGEPMRVNITSNLTVQQRPDLYYIPQMSISEFIGVERQLFGLGAYDAYVNNRTIYPAVSPVVEILDKLRNGDISEGEAESQIDYWRQFDVRDDLHDYFYRNALRQQYNLSLSGGGAKSSHLVSIGHDRNADNEVGNGLARTTVRVTNMVQPIAPLRIETAINYNYTNATNNHPGNISLRTNAPLYPYARLADDVGNPVVVEREYRPSFLDTVGGGMLLDWRYRPLEELSLSDNTTHRHNLALNINTSYEITPALGVEVRYRYQRQSNRQRDLQNEAMWNTRNTVNRFTQIVNGQPMRAVPLGAIVDRSSTNVDAHGLRAQFSFNKNWGSNVHRISAIAGAELRDISRKGNRYMVWGYDNETLTHQPVDLVSRHPIYGTLGSTALINDRTSFSSGLDRFISFYANGAYTYENRYTVSASVRRDASNLFGVSTNNKWKPLWSAGLAYTMSNEPFYQWTAIPYLKVRATYGYSGNVNNSVPAVTTIDYRGLSVLNRFPYAIVNNPPNPSLRWEQVQTTNIGVDFKSKRGRLSGEIEYYLKHATDLIESTPFDPTSGFRRLSLNVAHLKTSGADAKLNAQLMNTSVRWNMVALFSYNTSKVIKYLREWVPGPRNGLSISPIEGRGAYTLVSYRWAGLDPETGDPMGYLDGAVSKDYRNIERNASLGDLVFHGSAVPEYYGALRNNWAFRGLSLSVNMSFRAGYYFRRNGLSYNSLMNGNITHADFSKRWQARGDEKHTDVPSMVYPNDNRRNGFYEQSAINTLKGDHVRIQDIIFGYHFSGIRKLKAIGVKTVQLSLQASNLNWLIWRANNERIDPDFRGIPIPKSLSLGINITI